MSTTSHVIRGIARSPILWGILASVAFFSPFEAGVIRSQFVARYFTGHPVEYAATVLFFIGLAFLTLRAMEIVFQYQALPSMELMPAAHGGQPLEDCQGLLDRLDRLPIRQQSSYLVRRLRDGLEYLWRRDSTEGLDDQLKYLSDQDSGRMHADYGLLRLVVWAIPILGFLGTVIGITMAIANLAPDALEKSLPKVTSGLGVAFDTTALALALSIVLMFIQHYVDRAESNLLAEVDRRVEAELIGRFECAVAEPQDNVTALRTVGEQLIRASAESVERQVEFWRRSVELTANQWNRMTETAAKQLHEVLSAALAESLQRHASQLTLIEDASAERNRSQWGAVQDSLLQATAAIRSAQEKLIERSEVLNRVVDASGQVARLEETLNRNLADLAGTKAFEQMVMSLSAAVNLLNARLALVSSGTPGVQLEPRKRTGQAA